MQKGTKGAAEQFSKFVEGAGDGGRSLGVQGVEPKRKDFWDSFGVAGLSGGESAAGVGAVVGVGGVKKGSTVGTAALKNGGGGGRGAGAGAGAGRGKEKEEWGDEGWDKF